MKLKSIWYGAGALFLGVSAMAIVPLFARSKAPSVKMDNQVRSEKATILAEIESGNLKSAEGDARSLKAAHPNSLVADFFLADILYRQGRHEESRVIYQKLIFNPNGIFGDPEKLLVFGKLSEESGKLDDAKEAYSKVIGVYAYTIESPLTDLSSHGGSLSDYRSVAQSMNSWATHQPGFIADITGAVKASPNQPATHYIYAQLLNSFGRRFSANVELDKAAALLPNGVGAGWKAKQYKLFAFDRWDHGSNGVIGKGGKITYKVFKIPLTDSTTPMWDTRTATPSPQVP